MFKSLIAALAVVSVGTSALLVDSISRAISPADSLVARQYADVQSIEELEEQLPEACKATCEPTYPNLQKCYDQDREGCLEVCQQDEWDAMIDCSNCALREGGREFTDREASLLRQAMGLIERACRERGSTTDFKPLEVPTGSSPGSPSGDTTIWPSSIPAPTGATNAAMAHSAGLGGVAGGLLLTWLAW